MAPGDPELPEWVNQPAEPEPGAGEPDQVEPSTGDLPRRAGSGAAGRPSRPTPSGTGRRSSRPLPPPGTPRRPPGPTGLPTGPHPLLPNRPVVPPGTYTRRRVLVGLGGLTVVGAGVVIWRAASGGGGSGQAGKGAGQSPSGSTGGGSGTTVRGGPTGPVVTAPGAPALDGAPPVPGAGHIFDTVISGGRVMDPDSGFDATANIGIDGTTITAIATSPLAGKTTIDAGGLVVSPGFIDLLSGAPDDYGAGFKLADGVTTNLVVQGADLPASGFLDRYRNRCMVHYGVAVNDRSRRQAVAGLGPTASPNATQIGQLTADAQQQLDAGALGIGFDPGLAPGTGGDEMVALAKLTQPRSLLCTFDGRYSGVGDELLSIDEVAVVARNAGARCHLQNLISTGGTFQPAEALGKLAAGRQQGLDLSADTFAYPYWAAPVASARFDPGWQQRYRIDYGDLQIAGTGERLNAQTFDRYRQSDKVAVAYAIPEPSVVALLKDPDIVIASGAILTLGNNQHPSASGCFTRVLGRYVRDQNVLSLRDALAKMTSLPAQRLGDKVPALAKKGRVARGADADITVFDAKTVIDRSTVDNPAVEATGVKWVLVMGQAARTPKGNQPVHAGRPVVASP